MRRCGATKDEKDIRGRWKSRKRVSDAYDDVELAWPDTKMAGLLCQGGPCKYVIHENSNVSNEFILQYVIPNGKKRIPSDAAATLGTALLWYIYSPRSKGDSVT